MSSRLSQVNAAGRVIHKKIEMPIGCAHRGEAVKGCVRARVGAAAGAKRDQVLAGLFYRSGWTQQELAEVEGKNQSWVTRRVRFGRFLENMPDGINPDSLPKNLTERRFRSYWERTDKSETNERIRFRAVQQLMESEATLSKPRKAYRERARGRA